MANLGSRPMTGVLDPSNPLGAGNWTVRFGPREFGIPIDFEIYHIAVMGPIGSTFQVFIDSVFYDNVPHGDVNSWDPNQAMYLQPGRTLYFYYSVATGAPPQVTVFCREPTT